MQQKGYHLPDFEDDFGATDCPMLKINLGKTRTDIFFEVVIPTYKKTIDIYRVHSMPTFYQINDTFIRNEIVILSKYLGVDDKKQPIIFFDDINALNLRNCGSQDYLRYSEKAKIAFSCATDVLLKRSNQNCPTISKWSKLAVFSETKNGFLFSSPQPLNLNFSCAGKNSTRKTESNTGRIEFPETCEVTIGNTTFFGNDQFSEYFYSEDTLGIGDLSKFVPILEEIPGNITHITPRPPKSPTPLPELSPEVLREFRQHLEIISATGSFAILILILVSICALRIVNKWDRDARQAIPTSYQNLRDNEPRETLV